MNSTNQANHSTISAAEQPIWCAFTVTERLAMGTPIEVAAAVKTYIDHHPDDVDPLIFDAYSSQVIELDFRQTSAQLAAFLNHQFPSVDASPDKHEAKPTPRAVGRPKLGVVAREVTLLPRHWAWLGGQSGGASVALRKLVEQAMRENRAQDEQRRAQEATYRFMTTMAGNRPNFEEAARALFARDWARMDACMRDWSCDIKTHILWLAQRVSASATV